MGEHTCPQSDPGPEDITPEEQCRACHPDRPKLDVTEGERLRAKSEAARTDHGASERDLCNAEDTGAAWAFWLFDNAPELLRRAREWEELAAWKASVVEEATKLIERDMPPLAMRGSLDGDLGPMYVPVADYDRVRNMFALAAGVVKAMRDLLARIEKGTQ